MGAEVFHSLKKVLVKRKLRDRRRRRGRLRARSRRATRRRSRSILEAIEAAGYQPGKEIALALDCAASELYKDGTYTFKKSGAGTQDAAGHGRALHSSWIDKYPIVSIEDGLAEDDWDGWKQLTAAIGDRCQLVGDDLFVTNTERLARGIESGVAQRDPDQGEPDRHAHRDARGDRDGARRGLPLGDLASLGRDGGHVHRRPRGGDRGGADQDRLGDRAPIAWRSTTSCCASRSSSAAPRSIRAARFMASERGSARRRRWH